MAELLHSSEWMRATRVFSEHMFTESNGASSKDSSSENQLTSSHRFAEHLKQCCIQDSERLLRTLVDEKERVEKDGKQ